MKLDKILQNILILLSLITSVGAFIYKIYKLNIVGVSIALLLSLASYIIILLLVKKNNNTPPKTKISKPQQKKFRPQDHLFVFIYYSLYIYLLLILFTSRTSESILSPWNQVPNHFFVFYFIATLTIIFNVLRNKAYSLLLISSHFFLSIIINAIIYSLYFGFDPFVHQASLDHINKHGEITPKNLYYLGYYALTTIFHKISFIPVFYLNKFIVPFLAALSIPFYLSKQLNTWFNNPKLTELSLLFLFTIPFPFFTSSTPQNFSYLLIFLITILALNIKQNRDILVLYLLAIAALSTHPISGIPAILFVLIIHLNHQKKIKKKFALNLALFIILSLALPISFLFFNKIDLLSLNNFKQLFIDLLNFVKIEIPRKENFILNAIYLYHNTFYLLFSLTLLLGFYLFNKHKEDCRVLNLYLMAFLSLYFSFIVTKLIPFDFLISYEQSNYALRIQLLALFFLLPFILIASFKIITKVLSQNSFVKYTLLISLSILSTTALYFSYQRNDNYFNSHGYSTSQSDLKAVRWINENAVEDYIVLSNQQVSAAALKEYGFKKYHQANIFYYPIPTGGPLYQLFLQMVKEPNISTIQAAKDLTGVNEVYFVLNKYWWASDKIKEEAKIISKSYHNISKGEIMIFKY